MMAVFRYGIGIDFFAYNYLYNDLNPSVLNEFKYGIGNQEIGFRVLGALFKQLGLTFQSFISFFSIITIVFIAKLSKKYSKNPTLAMLIYYCFYYLTWVFSGIRQGLVLSVGLFYLLECIEKKRTKKFIAIVFLLSLIHSSAWMLLILYFLSNVNLKKRRLLILSLISIIISTLPINLIIRNLTWLPFYQRFIPYVNENYTLNILDFQSLGRLFFLFLAFFYYDAYSKNGKMDKKIISIYIINLSLYFLFQFSELIAARLTIYGKVLDIVVLSNVLYIYKDKLNKVIYLSMIMILSSLYLYKETLQIGKAIQSDHIIAPYTNIINKDDYYFNSRYNKLLES